MRSATWDVVAWNDAAAATLTDYTTLSPQRRNILRLIFVDPHVRGVQANWERVARFAVGAFRADVARGGATQAVQAFVDEMRAASAEFDALWRDHDVRSHEEGTKEIHHPAVGRIALEYSAFAVSGRPDQTLVIFTPETAADRALVRSLVARARKRWPSRCPSHDGARFIRRMCRHAVSPVAPSGPVAPLRPIAFRTDSQSNI